MVAMTDPETDRPLLDLALALAAEGEVIVSSVIGVPSDRPLAAAQSLARTRRRALDAAVRGEAKRSRLRIEVKVARRPWDAIVESVEREKVELLVLAWRRPGRPYLGTTLDEVLRRPPCDVAVVRGEGFDRARRILVPVRGGRYAQLSVRIATALAERNGGSVTLLHATERGQGYRRTRTALFDALGDRAHPTVAQLVTAVGPAAHVIAAELRHHDLIVLGATARDEATSPFGPIADSLARTTKPMLLVRTRTPTASPVFAQRPALPTDRRARSRFVSELVDKWFAENTFVSSEFADIDRLIELKEASGQTISLGLPALNEEATIGQVIRTMRSRLAERHALIDEIVVIDSGSQDRTREIALAEGVPVYVHQQILPELGAHEGKGEALWKSLAVLRGDIVCWVDTDIRNIHPKFVYGIVGPLLAHPRLRYVKAFYRRPLDIGGDLQATGGGRVTELTARPILNLFFPELSGMVQPLSGEYGGRRELLEQLPFFTGYGVETGLLIDVLQRAGLDAIAQTDMKQRIHRNQSLLALSKMAFAVLQVALKRVGEATGRPIWEEANASLKLVTMERQRYHLEVKEIEEIERPPMASVPQYRALRAGRRALA